MQSYLQNMIDYWTSLKKMEKHYAEERVKAEHVIQTHLQKRKLWKKQGIMSFGDLKIRIKTERKWDQATLTKVKSKNQIRSNQFPFIQEYKELKPSSDLLKQKKPKLWKKLSTALSTSRKKPHFYLSKSKA